MPRYGGTDPFVAPRSTCAEFASECHLPLGIAILSAPIALPFSAVIGALNGQRLCNRDQVGTVGRW